MNYKDVILEQYIDNYKEQHRIFYSTLSSMIFDMAFLQACVDLQDRELSSDWITVKGLHRDLFENLILKLYRCFFDLKGSDSTSFLKYKNNVLGVYLKEEYSEQQKDKVKAHPLLSLEYKTKYESIRDNVLALRNGFIGHRLLNASDECEVDLKDIRTLVEYSCDLFQLLSFEPRDFYSFAEGDGHNFSKEFAFTDSLTHNFISHSFLTSRYITKINCEFDEQCPKDVRERLELIIKGINSER